MNVRALGLIVTGGRCYVLSAADFLLIERTMRAAGAKTIYTDGREGVGYQVETWAHRRGIPLFRVTANWMHEGPATTTERNTTLVELARTVVAFPGEEPTDNLLDQARRRRLRIVESPGRLTAHRPTMDRSLLPLTSGPRTRIRNSPKL